MKIRNRLLALTLVFTALLSLAACNGEFHFAVGGGHGNGEGQTNGEYVPPTLNDDPSDDFTVTLMADGNPYTPRMEMFVYWTDGFSIHTAKVDDTGVARIDGLDGDYRVTLSDVPNEYTYDPNGNVATNDNRNIVLNLYTLNRLSGSGTGIYDCYSFSKTGVYSAVIENADDAIYFQYAPSHSGTYSIESWIDITEDNVDPYIEVYGGNTQFKYYIRTIYSGGAVGSYTMNFVHTVQIADENISAGGQATYTFAVKADSKNGKYPITVTFAVKRDGEFELNRPNRITGFAIPTFDFSSFDPAAHEYGNRYTLTYPEYQFASGSNIYVFDERRYQLWETEKGGDGFYHVYDKTLYADTDGYGPILYANVTSACRFIDRAFTEIEYRNGETINAALSVGGLNYKHFFEGYTFLSTYGNINGGSYYCCSSCTCHSISDPTGWACTSDCTNCYEDCRRIPTELIGHEGYQAYANSDGLVPVTKELQTFLQAYCKKETLFYDGKGTLETIAIDGKHFQAIDESGWLFACAYYLPN